MPPAPWPWTGGFYVENNNVDIFLNGINSSSQLAESIPL